MNGLFDEIPATPRSELSESNEWYTPGRYIEAARRVMGSIELDPASCDFANKVVQATRYYSLSDNGLMHTWHAESVFLNPPYGRTAQGRGSNLEQFTRHLIAQYQSGNVKQAILLIPVNTTTSWFVPLWDYPICFPVGRIRFYTEQGGIQNDVSFGTCFVYFGPDVQRFIEVFSVIGTIVGRISPAKAQPQTLDLWTDGEVVA